MAAREQARQVVAALKTALAAITADGSTYHYTPTAVRTVVFFDEPQLDSSLDYVILIRPGEERHEEESSGEVRALADLYVLVAKKYGEQADAYDEADPSRYRIANRMIRDVLRKLWSDPTLGGLAENISADPLIVDRARWVQGWALAELAITVAYTYQKAAP